MSPEAAQERGSCVTECPRSPFRGISKSLTSRTLSSSRGFETSASSTRSSFARTWIIRS